MTGAAVRPDPFASNEEWAAGGFPLPARDSDYRVTAVEVVDDATLHVTHRDGVQGYVRFEPLAFSGPFQPLSNPAVFRQARVEGGAVVWSREIDLAPDNMHRHLFAFGDWVLR